MNKSDHFPDIIVFYDGTCGFCHKAVQLSLKWLKDDQVYFSPLEGQTAAELRKQKPDFPADLDAIVLLKNNHIYLAEAAFFELSKHFKFPWKLLSIFRILPRFISGAIYKLVAKNRYRIFGRKDSCDIPGAEFKKRFLA